MQHLLLLGRILYALIFIMYGLMHFTKFGDMSSYAEMKGAPLPAASVAIGGAMIFLGGISILLGYKAKLGALLIFLFLIPMSLIMHAFWTVEDPMMAQNEMAHFLKNFALAGSALLIVRFGSGPLSLGCSDDE